MRRLTEQDWASRQGRWDEAGHDLPWDRYTLCIALFVVGLTAAVSSIWPLGFAS